VPQLSGDSGEAFASVGLNLITGPVLGHDASRLESIVFDEMPGEAVRPAEINKLGHIPTGKSARTASA
jgi:hypothetical protein